MKRRDFLEKTGCGVCGILLAQLGLTSCAKKEEAAATAEPEQSVVPDETATAPAVEEEITRKDMVKKMMIEKMGMTEEEADAKIAEAEEMLPMVKEKCICKTCPTFVAEETESAFCHPLVGQSQVITEEKSCDCGKCPVYQEMGLKNSYYCTRKSEMEQEIAKQA
jgi:hypothetical protein